MHLGGVPQGCRHAIKVCVFATMASPPPGSALRQELDAITELIRSHPALAGEAERMIAARAEALEPPGQHCVNIVDVLNDSRALWEALSSAGLEMGELLERMLGALRLAEPAPSACVSDAIDATALPVESPAQEARAHELREATGALTPNTGLGSPINNVLNATNDGQLSQLGGSSPEPGPAASASAHGPPRRRGLLGAASSRGAALSSSSVTGPRVASAPSASAGPSPTAVQGNVEALALTYSAAVNVNDASAPSASADPRPTAEQADLEAPVATNVSGDGALDALDAPAAGAASQQPPWDWPPAWFQGLTQSQEDESKKILRDIAEDTEATTLKDFYSKLPHRNCAGILRRGGRLFVVKVDPLLFTPLLEVVHGPGIVFFNVKTTIWVGWRYDGNMDVETSGLTRAPTFKTSFSCFVGWEDGKELDFSPPTVKSVSGVTWWMIAHIFLGFESEAGVMYDAAAKAWARSLVPRTAAPDAWWQQPTAPSQCAARDPQPTFLSNPHSPIFPSLITAAVCACRVEAGKLLLGAVGWLQHLSDMNAIPPLGLPQSLKPTLHNETGQPELSKNWLLQWNTHKVGLGQNNFTFYFTFFGHRPKLGNGMDAFEPYERLSPSTLGWAVLHPR